MLWYAAARFNPPTKRPPKQVLWHAAACFNCWCLPIASHYSALIGQCTTTELCSNSGMANQWPSKRCSHHPTP